MVVVGQAEVLLGSDAAVRMVDLMVASFVTSSSLMGVDMGRDEESCCRWMLSFGFYDHQFRLVGYSCIVILVRVAAALIVLFIGGREKELVSHVEEKKGRRFSLPFWPNRKRSMAMVDTQRDGKIVENIVVTVVMQRGYEKRRSSY